MQARDLIPFKTQLRSIKRALTPASYSRFAHNKGYCVICEHEVIFVEEGDWLRDQYKCNDCKSIPRNRALINALNKFYPDWKNLVVHESSPGGPLSDFIKSAAKNYSASYYFEDVPRGQYKDGFRSEDLTALTFPDATYDLLITSDVFEHVFNPTIAFQEIARVLKPGGAHVFTMPWYREIVHSRPRAEIVEGKIRHILEPVYHGNPISAEGSLVSYDWGKDFCDVIYKSSGLFTTIYCEKNRYLGLDAEYLEVFISVKP